jgi:predicted  nucleic acid-binding Zn-ribbon protein
MAEGGLMDDRIDNETALRDEIADLNERAARLRRELGALENEVRRREGEFIAIRSSRWIDDNE